MHGKIRLPMHTAVQRRRLQRLPESREVRVIAQLEMVFIATAGHCPQHIFAHQGIAFMTIGPAVLQHLIDPQFQQRRLAVPLHRMLQHHQIGALQCPLFGIDIDIEVGIQLIQRAHLHLGNILHGLQQAVIGMRMPGIGMGVNNQNHCCRRSFVPCQYIKHIPITQGDSLLND